MAGQQDAFGFDVVFPTEASQLEVFEKIGVDLVATAYDGYNASIFAYGQVAASRQSPFAGTGGQGGREEGRKKGVGRRSKAQHSYPAAPPLCPPALA